MVNIEIMRQLALSFENATELPHFERTSFRVKNKIFATLDIEKELACLMLSPVNQSVFSAFDKSAIYPVPNSWGKQGATYFELKKVRKDLFKDALSEAYKGIAEKTNTKKKK